MFHRFIMSLTYPTPCIFNKSLGCLPGSRLYHLFQHWHDRLCFLWVKNLCKPKMTFLLLSSLESTLFLFRLVSFHSHLFSTLLKYCFYPSACRFLLLFDLLTIKWYRACFPQISYLHLCASVTTAFFLTSMFLFSRKLGSTYSWTLTFNMLQVVLFLYKHLLLI